MCKIFGPSRRYERDVRLNKGLNNPIECLQISRGHLVHQEEDVERGGQLEERHGVDKAGPNRYNAMMWRCHTNEVSSSHPHLLWHHECDDNHGRSCTMHCVQGRLEDGSSFAVALGPEGLQLQKLIIGSIVHVFI
ncbi:unnamed protein product [Macrosiphum euphorbiae]|uniref:Uncharacterized protein n=1 Tax=Macrosiphum euphorbiae TaxID=13131 RepID=A0AAV0XNL6_9HEMI|nr:unnamed protein product [Macrosiphum euphorbiae]